MAVLPERSSHLPTRGGFDDPGPVALVRTEHHSLAEAGIDEPTELLREVCPWVEPLDAADVKI
jgi:hypothetical protein